MKDFIYESRVPIIYGASQIETVVEKIATLGDKALIIAGKSFSSDGKLDDFQKRLKKAGVASLCLENVKEPKLSKVKEGISLCNQENVKVVIGIGGGVCMDLAKTIAFGVLHSEEPLEKYLTYELSSEGLSHLPVVTIPTNPMSGSETNVDVQITLDESGLQVGAPMAYASFAWLNPEYVKALPDSILTYGQMTAFVQLSCNYLNLTRSMLAEQFAEASMKTILSSLRKSLADPDDLDARGTLMLCSALGISGINELGREIEFVPYPLQSFAQQYLGLNYPQALTGLFPYWMKAIYKTSKEKEIFHQYFDHILQIQTVGLDEETILENALTALQALYQEFKIAFSYGELVKDPDDHKRLVEIIDSFGPMPCQIMPVDSESLANIIENAIKGNLK